MFNGFHNPHQHTQCNNNDTTTVMIEHKNTFQYATTTSFLAVHVDAVSHDMPLSNLFTCMIDSAYAGCKCH